MSSPEVLTNLSCFVVASRDQRHCFGRDFKYCIRNKKGHKAIHKDLIVELGVDLSQQIASHDFERVFKALSDYWAVHGDLLVPQKFVVPRGDDAYSENAWGLKLGANLSHIRQGGFYPEHRDRLIGGSGCEF
jgi:hypothetical protein